MTDSYAGQGGLDPNPTQRGVREREEAARRFPPGTKVWVESARARGVVLGITQQSLYHAVVVVRLPSGYEEHVPCDVAIAGGLEVK